MRSTLLLGVALLIACGGDDSPGECRVDSDCPSGTCIDSMCEVASEDAGDAGDSGAPSDMGVDTADDTTPLACGGECEAGEACVDDACVADCRLDDARACPAETLCAEFTGRCVIPGEDCTPSGEFVRCGTLEFPPVCGPGSACDGNACVAAEPCADVRCDAGGRCRGVSCGDAPGMGGGEATGVTLDDVEDAARGEIGGLSVSASVDGMDYCGMSATFEVRIETALYTSAGNDGSIFEIDLETNARTAYVEGIPLVFGLVTDPSGTLYALRSDTCEVVRVIGDAGARTFESVATAATGCARLAIGPDGALYVAGGLTIERIDLFTGVVTPYGSIEDGTAQWGRTFLTGITFDDAGTLYVAEHWSSILALPPGGGVGVEYARGPALDYVQADNPWNEGMAFGPDGLLYVGVFPSNSQKGIVYRVGEDLVSELIEDLTSMRMDVPETNYTGIHGLAFGLDGALYFANQNTESNTREPFGQVLVRRTDGTVELISGGLNFDWPRGYDGDVVVGTRATDTVVVPLGPEGRASADLDVPDTDGAYEVRVFVTDPMSGRVFTDADTARTL